MVLRLTLCILLGLLPLHAWAEAPRPNVVVIMADDLGFSDIGCYGGEIETPVLDRLAAGGLRLTQFYNNAKCAPSRASLLTGRYSQQVGCHDTPVVMRDCATIAEVLRAAGYATYMSGKWHAGELPTERGFDRYFGLADGCCNYFNPGEAREGEPKPAEKNYPRKWSEDGRVLQPFTPESRAFYTTDAFTDHALEYLRAHDASRPFLLYVAYTAPHYPLQAPAEEIAKYRGRYSVGWDALRETRHTRQQEMGLLNPAWVLSPRDARIAAWTDLGTRAAWDLERLTGGRAEQLPWADAQDASLWDLKMAVYAAMVDRMDQNIGRLVAQLETMGVQENTLLLFLSDNGGCAELRNATPDRLPGPVDSYRTVDPPWANAQNTPFRGYKRDVYEGGISTPFIAHWPGAIAGGTMRHTPAHLIDLLPTLLALCGGQYPEGLPPLEGQSLVPLLRGEPVKQERALFWHFRDASAMREGDWKIVRKGSKDWELYDMRRDRSETSDVASAHPERVAAMSRAWDAWSARTGAEGSE